MARVVSRRSSGAARPEAGERAGRSWPLGVRPLRGSQVQVAPLSPRSAQPGAVCSWRDRERARGGFLELLDLSVGASAVSVRVLGEGDCACWVSRKCR